MLTTSCCHANTYSYNAFTQWHFANTPCFSSNAWSSMANTLHILLVLTHGVELLTYCVWVLVHDVAVHDVAVYGSGCDTHCGVACAVCCGSNTLAHNISTHCCCVITLYFCANSYCRHANTNCGHANTHRHRVNTHCFSANTHIVAVLTHKNPQIVNPSFVAGHSTLLPAHTEQT